MSDKVKFFLYRSRKGNSRGVNGIYILKKYAWLLTEFELDYQTIERNDLEFHGEDLTYDEAKEYMELKESTKQ